MTNNKNALMAIGALMVLVSCLVIATLTVRGSHRTFKEEPEFVRHHAVVENGGAYNYYYLVHKTTGVVYLQDGRSITMMRDVDGNPMTWDQIALNKELKDGR